MFITCTGTWAITDDSIRIVTGIDICRYYKWLFDRAHYHTLKTQTPRYKAHVNIISPVIHKGTNCTKYHSLHGKPIGFRCFVEGNYGGFTKGFKNFWLDVDCPPALDILKELGHYNPNAKYSPLHLTICNTKAHDLKTQ